VIVEGAPPTFLAWGRIALGMLVLFAFLRRASLVTYLVPIVGVAAGVLVLGEPFSARLVVGGLVVALGVALVQGRLLGPRQPDAERLPEPSGRA
jgi:drug/metabolite transporter (DMT)-like permease